MKKFFSLLAALLFAFAFNGTAHSMGFGSGDGSYYAMIQETAVFFNNSGGVLSAGDVVVLDTSGTGVSSGSTLGTYVTTTTSADSVLAIGVVKSRSSADQTPVVVVTKGPVAANCQNLSGTPVQAGTAVGSFTTARTCDSGTNLGIGIAAGSASQNFTATGVQTWIWVDPTGAD